MRVLSQEAGALIFKGLTRIYPIKKNWCVYELLYIQGVAKKSPKMSLQFSEQSEILLR